MRGTRGARSDCLHWPVLEQVGDERESQGVSTSLPHEPPAGRQRALQEIVRLGFSRDGDALPLQFFGHCGSVPWAHALSFPAGGRSGKPLRAGPACPCPRGLRRARVRPGAGRFPRHGRFVRGESASAPSASRSLSASAEAGAASSASAMRTRRPSKRMPASPLAIRAWRSSSKT